MRVLLPLGIALKADVPHAHGVFTLRNVLLGWPGALRVRAMYTSSIWRAFRLYLCGLAVSLPAGVIVFAQSSDTTVDLVLQSGRTLRVALDRRVTIRHAGQPVTGTLVEPLYVYDRVVLPIGARLTGHIERLEQPSKTRHTLAIWRGLQPASARDPALRFHR